MHVRASALIVQPAEAVFEFISSPANDHHWRSHLVSSRGRVTMPGDQVVQVYAYRGDSKTVEITVSEFDPPHRLTFTITEPMRARLSFSCRPEDQGTRLSAAISANLTGPPALVESRIQAELETLLRTDLARLKTTLEGR